MKPCLRKRCGGWAFAQPDADIPIQGLSLNSAGWNFQRGAQDIQSVKIMGDRIAGWQIGCARSRSRSVKVLELGPVRFAWGRKGPRVGQENPVIAGEAPAT